MFHMMAGYLAVLAVAVVYYAWRDGFSAKARQDATKRERVAYLLWVAAQRAG